MIWPQCVARAWQDAQFREALKRDPAGILFESYQFSLPEGVLLQVVENDMEVKAAPANTLRMVIPPAPAMDMQEIALIGPDAKAEGMRACDWLPGLTFSVC
ncbi:hypothetical protein [Hyalangium rubrum]|uniref:Nitrile hydratase alpha /Thiocyanate hydrolase gamma domain-containing protein n=1 Tax=Hyalangium rubrum TaxID=3103134 RepID=A0ABU5H665_9BACT|nr:hypothetical protein [Hyalangium sp. s54d21]MDY7228948.1 hypothetical protein [Hyalangium sp. s54d21]